MWKVGFSKPFTVYAGQAGRQAGRRLPCHWVPSGFEIRHDFPLSGLYCLLTPTYFVYLWA